MSFKVLIRNPSFSYILMLVFAVMLCAWTPALAYETTGDCVTNVSKRIKAEFQGKYLERCEKLPTWVGELARQDDIMKMVPETKRLACGNQTKHANAYNALGEEQKSGPEGQVLRKKWRASKERCDETLEIEADLKKSISDLRFQIINLISFVGNREQVLAYVSFARDAEFIQNSLWVDAVRKRDLKVATALAKEGLFPYNYCKKLAGEGKAEKCIFQKIYSMHVAKSAVWNIGMDVIVANASREQVHAFFSAAGDAKLAKQTEIPHWDDSAYKSAKLADSKCRYNFLVRYLGRNNPGLLSRYKRFNPAPPTLQSMAATSAKSRRQTSIKQAVQATAYLFDKKYKVMSIEDVIFDGIENDTISRQARAEEKFLKEMRDRGYFSKAGDACSATFQEVLRQASRNKEIGVVFCKKHGLRYSYGKCI